MVRNSRSALVKSAQKSFVLQNSRNAVGTIGQYKDTASGSASSELQFLESALRSSLLHAPSSSRGQRGEYVVPHCPTDCRLS